MKTLGIYNFYSTEDVSSLERMDSLLLKYDDILVIKNPKNIAELKEKLKTFQGQFDRVIIHSHGRSMGQIPVLKITQDDVDQPLYDLINIINDGNEVTLKEFRFFACEVGTGFDREENLQKMNDVVFLGQKVLLHSDEKGSLKENNYAVIKAALENKLGALSNSILVSPDAVNLFYKLEDGYHIYSHPRFFHSEDTIISMKNLEDFLKTSVTRALEVEKEAAIEGDPAIKDTLDGLDLREFLTTSFTTSCLKVTSSEEEIALIKQWSAAIESKMIDIPFPLLSLLLQKGERDILKYLIAQKADLSITEPETGATVLHIAAEKGHEVIIADLIEAGCDIEARRTDVNTTALFVAAENGHLASVKMLVEKGANLEAKRDFGDTAIYIAVQKGHRDIVNYLIKQKADLSITEPKTGSTVLHLAAENGDEGIIADLIEAGCDIEARRTDINATALFVAAENGHLASVKMLVEKGADLEAKRDIGSTAIFIAVEKGHRDIVNYLIKQKADLSITKPKTGSTVLHLAAENGDEGIIADLLDAGCDIEARRTDVNATALFSAAENGHLASVQMLVEKGANLEAKRDFGDTAIFIAVQKGHRDIVNYLIKQKADLSITKPETGATVLHLAAENGDEGIIADLLDAGCDIEARRTDINTTALFAAAENGHLASVKMLVEKGADLEAKRDTGSTAIFIAAQKGHKYVVRYFLSKRPDLALARDNNGETLISGLIIAGDLEFAKERIDLLDVLDAAKVLNFKGIDGWTPTMRIAFSGNVEMLHYAITKGADLDQANDKGVSCLTIAKVKGLNITELQSLQKKVSEERVRTHNMTTDTPSENFLELDDISLLRPEVQRMHEQGWNAQTGDNALQKYIGASNPLALAAKNGYLEDVAECIAAGEDINAKDEHDISPFEYLIQTQDHDIIHLAIANGANLNAKSSEGVSMIDYASSFNIKLDHQNDLDDDIPLPSVAKISSVLMVFAAVGVAFPACSKIFNKMINSVTTDKKGR